MKKLTMENVRILKRESTTKNHQAKEKIIMNVAPDQCSTNRNNTDIFNLRDFNPQ